MLWSLAFRGIALTLAIALSSLWAQLDAFGGTRGVQPVAVKLARLRLHLPRPWLSTPTVLWLGHSDLALHGWAALGVSAALFAAWGGPGARGAILVAHAIFLSFDCVFGLSMPWDCLLLEAGWLAPLLPAPAPLDSPGAVWDATPVHPAAAFLVRWLLFRVRVCGSNTRRHLHAQPLPLETLRSPLFIRAPRACGRASSCSASASSSSAARARPTRSTCATS